ncbi:MAG TPA: histidine kinase [Thermoanaerobaculia bacterium]
MPSNDVAVLMHLAGFLTGAALYGILFVLVARRLGSSDRLPLLTAILGLIWNLTGLAAYGVRDLFGRDPHPYLIASAYSALGFLPAVVVHSVLRSETRAKTRRAAQAVIFMAYVASTVAEGLLFLAAKQGIAPSTAALQVLTISYAALTLPVMLLTRRRRGSVRAWSFVALAVFAVSALHLSHTEGTNEPWLVELIGHHASIPLIFAILYQDFRFALADLFLKRALALFGLLGIAIGLYAGVQVPLLAQHASRNDPVAIGVSVSMWTAMALLYPLLRRGSSWIVDRLVLRRANYAELCSAIESRLEGIDDVTQALDAVTGLLRGPFAAASMRWTMSGDAPEGQNAILIPTAEAPRFAIVIGALAEGRRLLSDDMEMLREVALIAARRIDAIRMAQIRSLTTEAELRALRAQLNPHFLFNALNTIAFLIRTAPERAQETLLKLTSLLRAVLRSPATATLGDEIALVAAYLEIEQARFEERLRIEIDVPAGLQHLRIPPLIIQPLVENAIKHGIANSRSGGEVSVSARAVRSELLLTVRNSGVRTTENEVANGRRHGVGLSNLEARLERHFGNSAHLSLVPAAGETIVTVSLPLPHEIVARGA